MNTNYLSVTQYLINNGYVVNIAYFENSKIELGHEFCLFGYRMIFRVADSELIICYIESLHSNSLPGDFLKLFNFIYSLGKNSAELSIIRMMIIDNIANAKLQLIRSRMIKILIAKGAFSRNREGDDWLLFDVSPVK
ncbi:pathogenicity island 2 effector protein SseE [Yersinia rohdei]|nr:pathogenicity island 2 effector protein SseE [Yersinia rohdei]